MKLRQVSDIPMHSNGVNKTVYYTGFLILFGLTVADIVYGLKYQVEYYEALLCSIVAVGGALSFVLRDEAKPPLPALEKWTSEPASALVLEIKKTPKKILNTMRLDQEGRGRTESFDADITTSLGAIFALAVVLFTAEVGSLDGLGKASLYAYGLAAVVLLAGKAANKNKYDAWANLIKEALDKK